MSAAEFLVSDFWLCSPALSAFGQAIRVWRHHNGALESVGMRCLALAALCIPLTSGSVRAVVDDAWDWYSAMSPYEQCIDYLAGDPDIEQVLAKDLSYCDGLWGSPESE